MMLLVDFLNRTIRYGTLKVIDATGVLHTFSGNQGPEATIRLHDHTLHRKLVLNPELYIGEAYMDGTLTVEQGSLSGFLQILVRNLEFAQVYPTYATLDKFLWLMRRWQQFNPLSKAQFNAAHHYNLSDKLYDLFLDRDRQYSCAYFKKPGDTLETAQTNKKRHLAAKLLLAPGQRVLDIGSGWGGLAMYLAQVGGGQVKGLTLSKEQLQIANRSAHEAGLCDRVKYDLCDYREETGIYDRIVSVGMFEHVGCNHYSQFFSKIKELLDDKGICVLHSIGRMRGASSTCSWIRKYIFPGGYSPALSEVLQVIEKSGLWVTDIEILRLQYAETLRFWRRDFRHNRSRIVGLFDERFCRMWEFYLALSEAAFRYGDHFVFQMQIAKHRNAVPLTRDYIHEWEKIHMDEEEILEFQG